MAIDSIPPWLNVAPGDFTQAMEAGTRAGLELTNIRQRGDIAANELAERHDENQAQQSLAQQKLGIEQQESAAERALRQNLQQHAQELAQQKFGTQVALREAGQQIQNARLQASMQEAKVNELLRAKAEENQKAHWTQEEADRASGLDLGQKRLALEEKKAAATKAGGGVRESVKVPEAGKIFGGTERTYSGPPEAVESEIQKRTGKQAQGGYKINYVYKGLRYLGGDPNSQDSWEPVK
jgi:hypothetical protein